MASDSEKNSSQSDDVSRKEKLAYGFGTLPFELVVSGIKYLGGPIFNITLHLSPMVVGNVFFIIRLWDAFTDPFLGNLSDNTRSKWGRRKPYILFGAIGSALTFTFIWWVPTSIYGNAQLLFWYFLIFALLHYTFVTMLQVPFNALGFEMSSDYHGRTRVFAYRAFFAQIAKLILPWLYFWCQLPIFNGETMRGIKWVAGTAGVVIILFILPTVFKVKEGSIAKSKKQDKVKLLSAIGLTLKNAPFRILVFLTLVTIFGSNFVLALGYYINIYYVFDGDTLEGAKLVGYGTTVGTIVAFISIPILTIISTKLGKIRTLAFCVALLAVGSLLSWWLYTPKNPYLQLITYPFMVMGDMGFWLFVTSMKADICDWDEWKTGLRREGMYGAATGWFQKMAQAVTFGGAGYILVWIGFDAALEGAQSESTIFWLRLIYAGLPALLAVAGIIVLKFYPMDEKKAAEIKSELESRCSEASPG